jgi:hypothetical protein
MYETETETETETKSGNDENKPDGFRKQLLSVNSLLVPF